MIREPGARKAPAHAGRLSWWEQLAFALAFALMAAFVVAVTVAAIRAREHGGPAGSGPSGGSPRPGQLPAASAARNRALAAALVPVLHQHSGDIAVGVIDRSAGIQAVYHGGRRFDAAGLTGADLLAALLLRHQQAGTALTSRQQRLASQMIGGNGGPAAGIICADAGGAGRLAVANRVLGLRQTRPDPGRNWGLTRTTVQDQLRLLTDLTSASSPLSAGSRSAELGLIRRSGGAPGWGVAGAAAPGSQAAVQDGWLAGPARWDVDGIGMLRSHGQELLLVVLSGHQPTRSAGAAEIEAAARAAVTAITGPVRHPAGQGSGSSRVSA